VFAGGWTIEAAEVIAADDGAHGDNVLNLLSRLVDKSLVIVDRSVDGGRRYRFLETVRQYARERLVESGESERVRDRHLAFFHQAVRRAEPELTRERQLSWLDRLEREHDNLRAALEWCLAAPERGRQTVEVVTPLWWFWIKRGYYREGQEWLERALSAGGDIPPALRAKALIALGAITFFQGHFDRARQILDESATLARTIGDLSLLSFALGLSALASLERGDIADCRHAARDGQEAGRASATPWVQALSLS
jgi:non-specific serine/threonine protein kinase